MTTNEELEAGIYLFLKTLYDFNPYLQRPDEQERLINMPINVKIVLREIITSEIFSELILDNEYKKAEEKRKEKIRRREERKRQLIEGIKPMKIQDENYENNLKLMKNKRSLNTSCFNQRSIPTLNQYYNSVNEMMCIKDSVLNKIKKIERDSVISCIELENKNKIVHDKFVLMNPKNKNKIIQALTVPPKLKRQFTNESKFKVGGSARGNINNEMMLSRGFMSLDNYYKFIKKKLQKINDEQDDNKDNKYNKKKLRLDTEEKKNKNLKMKVYTNTEYKETLPDIKKFHSVNKNQMNYVLLNKDIKYQFKRTNFANNKKFVNKQQRLYLPYKNFDYKNILSLFK